MRFGQQKGLPNQLIPDRQHRSGFFYALTIIILGEIACTHLIIHILARSPGFTLQKNQHRLDHSCSNK